jgi:hypothetical protein
MEGVDMAAQRLGLGAENGELRFGQVVFETGLESPPVGFAPPAITGTCPACGGPGPPRSIPAPAGDSVSVKLNGVKSSKSARKAVYSIS